MEDRTLDVAVFSLSLMGTNWMDFISEAHRCLKPGYAGGRPGVVRVSVSVDATAVFAPESTGPFSAAVVLYSGSFLSAPVGVWVFCSRFPVCARVL